MNQLLQLDSKLKNDNTIDKETRIVLEGVDIVKLTIQKKKLFKTINMLNRINPDKKIKIEEEFITTDFKHKIILTYKEKV